MEYKINRIKLEPKTSATGIRIMAHTLETLTVNARTANGALKQVKSLGSTVRAWISTKA